MEILTTGGGLAVLISLWAVEARRLSRLRAALPLRIAITGTRGKSTVTRMLAAVLRASERIVTAKTTGSRPRLILPDGREEAILRRGRPTPHEQRRLLRRAVELGSDVLVAEMMSIRPESIHAESRLLLRPHILVITNALSDHWEHWGRTREEAARCLASAVPAAGRVYIPENEIRPVFRETAAARGSEIVPVGSPESREPMGATSNRADAWPENESLVRAVAADLALGAETIREGLSRFRPDFGAPRAWRLPDGRAGRPRIGVSAFAANDPVSSHRALRRVARIREAAGWARIGLLNLRGDRADRTLQWLEALSRGEFAELDGLAVVGGFSAPFARRLGRAGAILPVKRLSGDSPAHWMRELDEFAPGGAVVLGLGNIAGAGAALIEEWNRRGTPIAL